jgi:RecB family exonuclease
MFEAAEDGRSTLDVTLPTPEGPTSYSPHSLIDETVYENVEEGMGKDFGTQVHDFAERYVLGEDIDPRNEDEQHVRSLLDSLSGELRAEESAYLPLDIESGRITLSGVIDLLHISPERVEIIDYKTDRSRHAETEYRKQLSVYYHVLDALYPSRAIEPKIFYTESGTTVPVTPLNKEDLRKLVTQTEV